MRSDDKFKFDRIIKKIKDAAMIENTRVVFDFMQELNYRWVEISPDTSTYVGELGLIGRRNIGAELDIWLEKTIQETGCGNCYQNPLSNYLRIYTEMFDLSVDDSAKMVRNISPMLKLFNALQNLINQDDLQGDVPYAFEDLCLSLMEISNCDSCTFLSHKDGEPVQIISRCGSVAKSDDLVACINMRVTTLGAVIDAYSNQKTNIQFEMITEDGLNHELSFEISKWFDSNISGIKSIEAKDKYSDFVGEHKRKRDYLIFEFPFNLTANEKEDKAFYMILDYSENDKKALLNNDPTMVAFKILTFRSRLWRVLKDNYLKLIHTKFDYGYIKSVVEDGIGVLHVSDIHLSDEKQWNTPNGSIITQTKRALTDHHNKVDLLAITGDIVNGSSNASDAQKKYSMVGSFLKEIAITLWAEEIDDKIVLPHDWKKRILIVPGNHDYSAMSDVIVETASRRIRSGFPSDRSGGTMSKLTYYIEFMMNFLDAPIDELVENDMNEIRDYKKLKIKVALFNSISKVNSLQNNKVSLDYNKVRCLINKKMWNSNEDNSCCRIVLMHHAAGYKINYFNDKYEFWKYNIGNLYSRYYELLIEWIKNPKGALRNYRDLMIEFKKDFENMSNQYSNEFLKSQLYSDMVFLIRIYEEAISKDEYYEDYFAKHNMTYTMQEKDGKNFKEFYNKYIKDRDIILAGHEHRNNYYLENNVESYVVPKVHSANGTTNTIAFSVYSGKDIDSLVYNVHCCEVSSKKCTTRTINCPCASYKNNKECNGNCF